MSGKLYGTKMVNIILQKYGIRTANNTLNKCNGGGIGMDSVENSFENIEK
jgi:hypothetical protein